MILKERGVEERVLFGKYGFGGNICYILNEVFLGWMLINW